MEGSGQVCDRRCGYLSKMMMSRSPGVIVRKLLTKEPDNVQARRSSGKQARWAGGKR